MCRGKDTMKRGLRDHGVPKPRFLLGFTLLMPLSILLYSSLEIHRGLGQSSAALLDSRHNCAMAINETIVESPQTTASTIHSENYYADRAIQHAEVARNRSVQYLRGAHYGLTFGAHSPTAKSFHNVTLLTTNWSKPAHDFQFAFQYSKPAAPNQFTLPHAHPFLNNTMIVLTLSSRGNFDVRATIRETWAKNHPVYFVIGGPSLQEMAELRNLSATTDGSLEDLKSDVQMRLEEEQSRFHDLIDSIHPEAYPSLPHKVRFGYRWVIEHNPHVEWLVKADDDQLVRVNTLERVYLRKFNPYIPTIVGQIMLEGEEVAREGKWAEPLYPKDTYPIWPQGKSGHVVSRVVAEYIAFTPGLTYYQGEDVSIGIWMYESSLKPNWIYSTFFTDVGDCDKDEWLILGHKLGPEYIRKCYERMDEWTKDIADYSHRRWAVASDREA